MKNIYLFNLLLLVIIVSSCGEGTVSVTNESYEPKIVIEGFLVANQKVEKIRIARNFPIDANLQRFDLIPDVDRTQVTITDVEKGTSYDLTFHIAEENNFDDYYWEYNRDDLIIECGKTYRLNVSAPIDGCILHASSTTTVPLQGLKIVQLNYDRLHYRQQDENNQIVNFKVTIERSPGTTFYLTTMQALEANKSTYIYDNPYEDVKPEDVTDDVSTFRYDWIQNTPSTSGQSEFDIYWNSLRFYCKYEVIVYASDENYMSFLQTYNDVQEPDGNFHEPRFNIEGDGIGVFGSTIADTVYIEVLRN